MVTPGAFAHGGDPTRPTDLDEALRGIHGLDPGPPHECIAGFVSDPAAVRQLAGLVAGIDHVGFLVAPGTSLAAARAALFASPYSVSPREFPSRILGRDLSATLGRPVDVSVVSGRSRPGASPIPEVELFIAAAAGDDLEELVAAEYGRHLALRLAPGVRVEEARQVILAAAGEGPEVRSNPEIGVSLLYLQGRRADGRYRRLELVGEP